MVRDKTLDQPENTVTWLGMLGRFGRLLFSLAIIGIGVETLICSYVSGHKVVPVIPWVPAIPSLAYLVGTIFILCGAGLLFQRTLVVSSITLGVVMLLCGLAFDVPRHLDLMSAPWRTNVLEPIAIGSLAWLASGLGGIPGWLQAMPFGLVFAFFFIIPLILVVIVSFWDYNDYEMLPALTTRSYVDTGPIVERVFAKYAGVGWIGKNTCIINQKRGSWLFLGVILTSLELAPDMPAPDRCGTCTRCIEACPTDAILAPYQLDSNKCISYLTIEKRGSIPEHLRAGMGRHVFGCDICQDVCPWNRKAPASSATEFEPRPGLVNPALAWLAEMSPEEFREVFRGSPIRRTKRSGLRRNAAIAMGNSGNKEFLPLLDQLAGDEDQSVRESANWARTRLSTATE